MAQEESKTQLSAKQEAAALLLADDKLSDELIADEVKVDRRTLARWKKIDAFAARVDELLGEIRTSIRQRGISIVENRVRALQDRWDRMKRVIEERGASAEMQSVPGGSTGLLVHNVKSIGGGENAERVDLYEFDAALLKEMREHEKQAAQELGQWTENHDLKSDGKAIAVKVLSGVSMNEL